MDENSKKEVSKDKKSIKAWFLDIKGEFKKIIWPSRNELVKQTFTVILTSAVFGVLIMGLDGIFAQAYTLFINLIGYNF